MMKQTILLPALFTLLAAAPIQSQVLFERRYGVNNANFDFVSAAAPAPGGNLIACGYTEQNNAHVIFIQKLDTAGAEVWYRQYNQFGTGIASGIQPAAGGGYLVSGYSVDPADGSYDALLLKVSENGDVLWNKTFGTAATEAGLALCQLANGNIVLLGATIQADNEPAFLRAVFDANGTLLSSKYFQVADDITDIRALATADGGYLILITAGYFSTSTDVIKYDAALDQQWVAPLSAYTGVGGTTIDALYDLKPTAAGFLLCVETGPNIDLLHIGLDNTPLWSKRLRSDFAFGAGIQPYADGTIGVASSGVQFFYKKLSPAGEVLDSVGSSAFFLSTNYEANYVFNADRGVFLIGNGYAGDARVYNSDYVSVSGALPVKVWNQAFGTAMPNEDETGDAIAAASDGGFVLAGSRYDSTGQKDVWVLKADAQGAKLWEKTIPIGSSFFNNVQTGSVKIDGNGNIAVLAASSSSEPEYHLILLSPTGNLIFDKVIATADYQDAEFFRAYPIPGGGYVACITFYTNQLVPRLIRTDAGGNVLWSKAYTGSLINDLAVLSDNAFVGAGDKSDSPWVFKVDGSGNLVWEKTYPSAAFAYAGLNSITVTADGNLAAVGIAGDFDETNIMIDVLKASAVDGTLLWQKQLSKGNNSFWLGSAILPTPSNGVCFVGNYLEPPANPDYLTSIFRERASITTLSAAGNVLFDLGLGNDASRPDGVAADCTPDGNIIVTATIYNGTSLQDAWVAKVAAKTVAVTGTHLDSAFSVFPNPAAGLTHLSLTDPWTGPVQVQVLDAAGRAVIRMRESKQTATWTADLPLAGLLPGTYWVRVETGAGVAVRPVVVVVP